MSGGVPLPGVAILLPCFNEIDNIERAVAEARAAAMASATDYQIVVVDDGSSDGTGEKAEELAAADRKVTLRSHTENRGYGMALRTGIAAATMPWILLTDADLQFD